MKRLRAFIAADITNRGGIEKLQKELSEAAGWRAGEVRPVENQNLHFTLIFLGDIGNATVEAIKSKLSELNFESIKITYSGLGGFPSLSFANVIWIGVDQEGSRRFTSVADSVISKIKDIGISPNKPFTPHLTIFRVKKRNFWLDERLLARYIARSFGTDTIEKISLKMSTLSSLGASYSDIFTVQAK